MYIIKKFIRNRQKHYLIPDNYKSKSELLEHITRQQARKKEFKNVQIKPYHGHKYNNVIYVVEG